MGANPRLGDSTDLYLVWEDNRLEEVHLHHT